MFFKAFRPLAALFCALLLAAPALAQQGAPAARPPVDVLSATSLPADAAPVFDNEPTHPTLDLTPDKSELVHLDREAGTVIVGNPQNLSILLESNQNLVLVGKTPGATYFTVLDDEGKVIMQRHVIVGAPKEHYVRIKRSCAGGKNADCQETSVFYCPDMCHNVSMSPQGAAPAAKEDTTADSQVPLTDTNVNTTGAIPEDQAPLVPPEPPGR